MVSLRFLVKGRKTRSQPPQPAKTSPLTGPALRPCPAAIHTSNAFICNVWAWLGWCVAGAAGPGRGRHHSVAPARQGAAVRPHAWLCPHEVVVSFPLAHTPPHALPPNGCRLHGFHSSVCARVGLHLLCPPRFGLLPLLPPGHQLSLLDVFMQLFARRLQNRCGVVLCCAWRRWTCRFGAG